MAEWIYESRLGATECYLCGTPFAFPALAVRRKDGRDFYCPNGHIQSFGEALDVKLQHSLDKEIGERRREVNQERTARFTAERERDRALEQLKRLKRKKR